MSFRARLVVAFVSISLVTLGGTFVIIYLAVKGSELSQLDAALIAEAREEAAEIHSAGSERLVIGEGPGPTVDDIGPLTKYAALYEDSGELIDSTDTFGEAPPELEELGTSSYRPFDLVERDERLRGVLVPVPDSPHTLLLAAPRVHLEQDSRYLWRVLVALLAVGGVFSFALAAWVSRRLTQEHRRIAEVVRRISDGDLSQRVAMRGKGETAQLAADIDEMIERLDLLLDTQKRFIAHASHEMRSPLSILYGELSHALRRPRSEDEYRSALVEAHGSARHLTDLIDDLLALARLGSGEERVAEPVDLRESVRRAIDIARRAYADREVNVVVEGGDATIEGHASDTGRMIGNLVNNAILHSPPQGTVRVTIEPSDARVALRVRDEGPGVPAGEEESIFEPFYRGSGTRAASESGTGLGLAIARETARSLGGDVFVEPSERGACFTVSLPRARLEPAAAANLDRSANPI